MATDERPRLSKSDFIAQHVNGKTDRELLEACAWASYQSIQIGIDNADRLAGIRDQITEIDREAKEMVNGLSDPSKLMGSLGSMFGDMTK